MTFLIIIIIYNLVFFCDLLLKIYKSSSKIIIVIFYLLLLIFFSSIITNLPLRVYSFDKFIYNIIDIILCFLMFFPLIFKYKFKWLKLSND